MRHYLSAVFVVLLLCSSLSAHNSFAQQNQDEATLSKLQSDVFALEELIGELTGKQEELHYNLQLISEDIDRLSEFLQNSDNNNDSNDNATEANEALLQRLNQLEELALGSRLELLESENIGQRLKQLEADIKSQSQVAEQAQPQPADETTAQTAEASASAEIATNEEVIQTAYSTAFSKLAERQYEAAEADFKSFVANYPNHPLTANAVYWIAESYYVRADYRTAAQQFLTSYNNYPKGGKRYDSLLKLSLSLKALKVNDQACKALDELLLAAKTEGEVSDNIRTRAEKERDALQCP